MRVLFDSWKFEGAAIFFDKDGTLVDLRHQYTALMEKRLERLVALCPVDEPGVRRAIGLAVGYDEEKRQLSPSGPLAMATRAETMEVVAKVFTDRGMSTEKALEIAQRAFLEADQELSLADLIKPAEGLKPVLSSLYRSGLTLACLTNDEYERTRKILRLLGVVDFFHLVVCGNEVTHPKPDPEMFHRACCRLGILPSKVAYIGDSIWDMNMARSAGAGVVVGILGGASRGDILREKADVVIPNLRAIGIQSDGKILRKGRGKKWDNKL